MCHPTGVVLDCHRTSVQVGVVTSACQDAEGEWVGLGYVRSRVEGTQLQLEGGWTALKGRGQPRLMHTRRCHAIPCHAINPPER